MDNKWVHFKQVTWVASMATVLPLISYPFATAWCPVSTI